MHARLLAAGLAGALLASSAMAAEPTDGFYGTIGGGANFLNDIRQPPVPKLSFEDGPSFTASLGYGFGNGFRTELNYLFARSFIDSSLSSGASGHLNQHAGLVNVLYDFTDINPSVIPHVGAGVGFDELQAEGPGGHSDYQTHFAYNFIGGFEVPIDDSLKVGVDYRYLSAVGDNGTALHKDADNNIVLLTLRYDFSQPEPPPAPAPPPPPPPVVAPPPPPAPAPEVARQFQVFFDFDKSDLTAAAAKVVHDAADAVKAGNIANVNVVGHTDTTGSVQYNQALSERRAEAVKAELIADGVSSTTIETSGVGKTDLLVPTKDGVRDPQNRRAVITLH